MVISIVKVDGLSFWDVTAQHSWNLISKSWLQPQKCGK